ncbi:NHL repeat-containing protein [Streptomyces griseocarneus]|uniref:NHL repeat-containing protein n=1 Tax=Streptomyces griseocarneus TaxID=51201 RepID=UPI00199CCA98|nr:NHL repeat-containing protein [Streptomyces griseocarneus]GHG60019.1 hypothetical protein GCM10018779_26950 [Streptomyces griseocarneus]
MTSNGSSTAAYPDGTIVTTAGTGAAGFISDGGPAAGTPVSGPNGVAVDRSGNLYIADTGNHRVRKVTPAGIITTVAGTGQAGFVSDGGPAVATRLYHPTGVAVDGAGNLYIADRHNHRIRKVTTNGIITTVAGNGQAGFVSDGGPAVATKLHYPWAVAVDADGGLLISDTNNHRIRKVTPEGNILTVAGNGQAGFVSDGGPAIATKLYHPFDVVADGEGGFVFADRYNHRVRKVSAAGVITTVAGTGTAGYVADGGPAVGERLNYPIGVALDAAGNLYIGDNHNHRVRRVNPDGIITTIAGTGTAGYIADGGPAVGTSLYYPNGLAVAPSGSLYIADGSNHRIRRIYGAAAVRPPVPPLADLYGDVVAPAIAQRGQEFELGARVRSRGPATVDGEHVTVVLNLPAGLIPGPGASGSRLSRTFRGIQLAPYGGSLDGVFRVVAPESTAPGTYEATLEIQYGGELNLKDNTEILPVTIVVPAPPANEKALTIYQEAVPEATPGQAVRIGLRFLSPTGQPVNPGVITQRYTAPTGFAFAGQPLYTYHNTSGGVVSGALDYEVYDGGRTLVIRANPHLNTTTTDTGSLVYTVPLRAQPDATAGLKSDGSASIGQHAPVQILAKVTGTAGEFSARVTQSQQDKARVRRGQQWVYPAVLTVTNTGQREIGAQQIVLTAPQGLRFTEDRVVISRQGTDGELSFQARRSADQRTLTADDVRLDLAPGQWAVLYPELEVDANAPLGAAQVGIQVGSPVFASGQAAITVEP